MSAVHWVGCSSIHPECAVTCERRRVLEFLDELEKDARDRIEVASRYPVVERMRDYHQARLDTINRIREYIEG